MTDEFELLKAALSVTDAQAPTWVAIATQAEADARSDPSKLTDERFQQSVMMKVRAALGPDQQRALDEMLRQGKATSARDPTPSNLHQIGLAILLWQADHDQRVPPDLGTLAADVANVAPDNFLISGSKTHAPDPAAWATMTARAHAEWVTKSTDLAYVARQNDQSVFAQANFVVAYVKPELEHDGNSFLMGDGAAFHRSAGESKAILDDLKTGKNPPPSIKAAVRRR